MRTNLRLINSFNQVTYLLRYALSRVCSQPNFVWYISLYKRKTRKAIYSTNSKGSYKELVTQRISLFVAGTLSSLEVDFKEKFIFNNAPIDPKNAFLSRDRRNDRISYNFQMAFFWNDFYDFFTV